LPASAKDNERAYRRFIDRWQVHQQEGEPQVNINAAKMIATDVDRIELAGDLLRQTRDRGVVGMRGLYQYQSERCSEGNLVRIQPSTGQRR